ncbi:hypothetical protein GNIT_0321 [Glaciecola nitratireducens FR1064]|uniref:Uncharacterized protein n=1 Tax=Glaciecola nitratireducens (strain JCM 12485 / KCTC 12276 / FR1064) TaxID=1085623 RepID=G4QFD1_GLANF|nr:hypothetical protein GNIT_0321 [Glaciecola nitratireducens FR1064]
MITNAMRMQKTMRTLKPVSCKMASTLLVLVNTVSNVSISKGFLEKKYFEHHAHRVCKIKKT